jgi:uncharacterized protein with HEPN domain
MPRDFRLYLDDILDAIQRIETYTEGLDFEAFKSDLKTQDAVVRNLEIIGEAAGKLPEDICALSAEIEWNKIVGLRNILIHEYFGINLSIIWDVIQNKIHPLKQTCQRLLTE